MSVQSISEFMQQAGVRLAVTDMGRRMQALTLSHFSRLENGQQPCPQPFQQHAWLGLLGWSAADPARHFIWFLKLPLDELGLISPTARDEVLHYLLHQVGTGLLQDEATQADKEPADLPHGFRPGAESMAMFHARAACLLQQPPSRYYQPARDYLTGKQGYEQWAFVGLQGLAEIVARLEEDNNLAGLMQALPELPPAPLTQLYRFLEHVPLPAALGKEIIRLSPPGGADQTAHNRTVGAIRALSACEDERLTREYLQAVLECPAADDIEILAAISGRCWQALQAPQLASRFLERLARNPAGQHAFTTLLLDLLAIPGMREPLLATLRSPQRSATLAAALGKLFSRLATA